MGPVYPGIHPMFDVIFSARQRFWIRSERILEVPELSVTSQANRLEESFKKAGLKFKRIGREYVFSTEEQVTAARIIVNNFEFKLPPPNQGTSGFK